MESACGSYAECLHNNVEPTSNRANQTQYKSCMSTRDRANYIDTFAESGCTRPGQIDVDPSGQTNHDLIHLARAYDRFVG